MVCLSRAVCWDIFEQGWQSFTSWLWASILPDVIETFPRTFLTSLLLYNLRGRHRKRRRSARFESQKNQLCVRSLYISRHQSWTSPPPSLLQPYRRNLTRLDQYLIWLVMNCNTRHSYIKIFLKFSALFSSPKNDRVPKISKPSRAIFAPSFVAVGNCNSSTGGSAGGALDKRYILQRISSDWCWGCGRLPWHTLSHLWPIHLTGIILISVLLSRRSAHSHWNIIWTGRQ